MTLVAKYIGQNSDNTYWVNVKTAKPTGNLGDAGVIRRFDTEQQAKEYAKLVNETGVDTFVKCQDSEKPENAVRHEGDSFVSSTKNVE